MNHIVNRFALLLFCFYMSSTVLAATPAGTTLSNQAKVTLERAGEPSETLSPTVTTLVRAVTINLQKTAVPNWVAVGDKLTYTLKIVNTPNSVRVDTLHLVDTLPAALSYVPGSSVVTRGELSVVREPERASQTLSWDVPALEPGETVTLTFQTTPLPTAMFDDELVNRAQAFAEDGAGLELASVAASAVTEIDRSVFEERAVLLGTAFVDTDQDGRLSAGDTPVPDVRFYLSDGRETVTDAFGRYTFQALEPSLTALRVDTVTLPARYLAPTYEQDKPGLWRVRLLPGVITRRDVPFTAPRAELAVQQHLNLTMGPVVVEKQVEADGDTWRVRLDVASSEPLRGLVLSDTLPAGAELVSAPIFEDGDPVAADGLVLALGDVGAGYRQTIFYHVTFASPLAHLLGAPNLRWDVR